MVTALGSLRKTAAQGPQGHAPNAAAEKTAAKPGEPKKFQDFNELTKDSKKYDGFLTLHEKEQHLYAEIKPNQLEQPILAPIDRPGLGQRGQPAELRRRMGAHVPAGG